MNISKKGFSIIEIIISLAILIIISIIAVTYNTKMVDKSNNSKIISDITTLENSLTSYKNDTSKIPNPNGNLKYFKSDTSYAHDETEAFGVSGFITEKTIPAKYINYLPVDPKNGQYYAIGETFSDGKFELAGIIKSNGNYQAKVSGTWEGVSGPYNLIREYNGPNFVYDNSSENFPYNPDELLLTAKINSFSGTVSINKKVLNEKEILNFEIKEGDKIKVSKNGFVELYLSDGSYSVVGDTENDSEITLSNMRYIQKNNLFTNVKIVLNMGNIWTKAPKLGEESEYEIYTTDTVAAVRGTVFGLRKTGNNTSISVLEGKVEVSKIKNDEIKGGNSEALENYIKDGEENNLEIENVGKISGITNSGGIIEVLNGESTKSIKINDEDLAAPDSSSLIEKIPGESRNKIEKNESEINNAVNLEVLEIKNSNTEGRIIRVKLNNILKKGNIVKINGNLIEGILPTENETLTLSGRILSNNDIVNLSICKDENCSNVKKIDFSKQVSYKKVDLLKQDDNEDDDNLSEEENNLDLADIISFDSDLKSNRGLGYEKGFITSYPSQAGNLNIELKDLNPKKVTEDNDLAIYKVSGIKGLFLDNLNNDDFVKYKIGELGIGQNYAIEMSVRGGALNRRDGKVYTLFDTDSVKLGIINGKFCSGIGKTSCSSYYKDEYGKDIQILNNFKADDFYKIIFTSDSNGISLKITDLDDEGNIYYEGRIKNSPILLTEWLFVGSTKEFSGEYFNQWNDIIDYVKIYKK